ncbi:hypothetical protein STENM223S_01845 [Streptomyces tendae]
MSGFPGTLEHDIARAGPDPVRGPRREREPGMAGSPKGPLTGRVALVAGATRGAGRAIAVELGAAGATVYVTGRSTRARRSEYDRPETVEDTADLVTEAGGRGIAVPTDHLDPAQVATLVDRIAREQARLDVLVNDIWGGEHLFEWDSPVWEHDLDNGLRLLRLAVETHAVTSHHACRCCCAARADWSSRSPTAPTPTTATTTATASSTTSPRPPSCGWPSPSVTNWARAAPRRSR